MEFHKKLILACLSLYPFFNMNGQQLVFETSDPIERKALIETLREKEALESAIWDGRLNAAKGLINFGVRGQHVFFCLFLSDYCFKTGLNDEIKEFARILIDNGYNINETFQDVTVLSRISNHIKECSDILEKAQPNSPGETLKRIACFIVMELGGTPPGLNLDSRNEHKPL